ncbi:TspO/MBR family protein [Plebeiibacterium marinum]|uniref:Tryptophan-rich sensory protein n=1 Tax=Plebeiibacterium marinum TaxID=2992111 RepID=A0AAE3MEE8_9BACT|nr:TspO/MBR family protein [Plebeiobacterium marinum]MCW3806082.1 tryptophan-rich sensory protein [Plebeiobacterium marinum]
MKTTLFRFILFLVINFGALAVAGIFTGKGVPSEWYVNLSKAPWTPPGWMFGLAWTTIMICFSLYLMYLWPLDYNKKRLIGLFVLQWVLNISWSPVFFHFQKVWAGLIIIGGLTIVIGVMLVVFWPLLKTKSILLLPYFLWLLIATSLNAYILVHNTN